MLEIYSQKGGWEGWAQVELARAIKSWHGGSCTREYAPVYGAINNERADILHENLLNNNNAIRNVIELKCQSAGQDEVNITGFANAYTGDAIKIGIANRAGAYAQHTWYVIGIAPGGTQPGGAVANAINEFGNVNYAYRNSTRWTQRDQYSPVIFWTTY